jgi:hypothetical protein
MNSPQGESPNNTGAENGMGAVAHPSTSLARKPRDNANDGSVHLACICMSILVSEGIVILSLDNPESFESYRDGIVALSSLFSKIRLHQEDWVHVPIFGK